MSAFTARTVFKTLINTAYKNVRFKSMYKAAVLEGAGNLLVIKELERNKLRVNEKYRSESHTSEFVPGYEMSGEIIELGRDASKEFIMGEKVAALTLEKYGGFAEEIVVDMYETFRIPPNLSLKDAAVIVYGHSLALYTFGKLSEVKKDNNVIITVGAGGLGLAGVDVAANVYKSKVIAVTETEHQSELTRELGAFQTLHYNKNLETELKDILSNKGADMLYNSVSINILEGMLTCVRLRGIMFSACPIFEKHIPIPPPNVSFISVSLSKLREQDVEAYRTIVSDALEMADQGIITAHISEKFDLKDVNKAIEFLDEKKSTGKVILKMN